MSENVSMKTAPVYAHRTGLRNPTVQKWSAAIALAGALFGLSACTRQSDAQTGAANRVTDHLPTTSAAETTSSSPQSTSASPTPTETPTTSVTPTTSSAPRTTETTPSLTPAPAPVTVTKTVPATTASARPTPAPQNGYDVHPDFSNSSAVNSCTASGGQVLEHNGPFCENPVVNKAAGAIREICAVWVDDPNTGSKVEWLAVKFDANNPSTQQDNAAYAAASLFEDRVDIPCKDHQDPANFGQYQ